MTISYVSDVLVWVIVTHGNTQVVLSEHIVPDTRLDSSVVIQR